MISRHHPTEDELAQLLFKEDEPLDSTSTGTVKHLEQCESCRQALELLVAQPEQWTKALLFLREPANDASSPMDLGKLDRNPRKQNDTQVWQYSTSELLDPPNHPEMLGRLGEYDIECEVGRGAMGIVFKAFDSKLHRRVAIKAMAPHLAGNGVARKRFAQEAVAAAGVIHPNVIAVHGVNDQGKIPFMVMPYVEGVSLQSLVDGRGPLSEINIVRIALQISAGLAAAHSQGLVHRDIKPANILVEPDVNRVVITDFGLAQAANDASLTQTGWLTGTPNYMSPEQACGKRPDHRSDLFSLGSTLFFLATGNLPFRSETALGVLSRIQNESPTPVRQVNGSISPTLSDIICCLLAKQPEDRFQSAAELHDILQKLLAHLHQPDESGPPRIRVKGNFYWRNFPFKKWAIRVFIFSQVTFLILVVLGYSFVWGLWSGWGHNSKKAKPSNGITNPDRIDTGSLDLDGELLIQNATNFRAMKRYDAAIKLLEEAARYPNHSAFANYNLGCIWAVKGDSEKSLAALSTAIDQGFTNSKLLQTEKDLASLQGDPRFLELLQRLQ